MNFMFKAQSFAPIPSGTPVSPTVLASGTGTFNGSSVGTTSSVTPNANEVVYLIVGAAAASGPVPDDSFSASGNGLTWVRVEEVPDSGRRTIAIFRALGASPSTGAITITEGGAADFSFLEFAYAVVQFSDSNTSGTDGSGATGTPATNTGTGTSLGLTITGTPGTNDATFGAIFVSDGGTSITEDALWVNLAEETISVGTLSVDWDAGQDLSPTWTWTGSDLASAAGFIVIAA